MLAHGVLQRPLPFSHLVVDRRLRRRLGSLLPEPRVVDVVVERLNGRHPAGVGANKSSRLRIPRRIPFHGVEEPRNGLGALESQLGVQRRQFFVGRRMHVVRAEQTLKRRLNVPVLVDRAHLVIRPNVPNCGRRAARPGCVITPPDEGHDGCLAGRTPGEIRADGSNRFLLGDQRRGRGDDRRERPQGCALRLRHSDVGLAVDRMRRPSGVGWRRRCDRADVKIEIASPGLP